MATTWELCLKLGFLDGETCTRGSSSMLLHEIEAFVNTWDVGDARTDTPDDVDKIERMTNYYLRFRGAGDDHWGKPLSNGYCNFLEWPKDSVKITDLSRELFSLMVIEQLWAKNATRLTTTGDAKTLAGSRTVPTTSFNILEAGSHAKFPKQCHIDDDGALSATRLFSKETHASSNPFDLVKNEPAPLVASSEPELIDLLTTWITEHPGTRLGGLRIINSHICLQQLKKSLARPRRTTHRLETVQLNRFRVNERLMGWIMKRSDGSCMLANLKKPPRANKLFYCLWLGGDLGFTSEITSYIEMGLSRSVDPKVLDEAPTKQDGADSSDSDVPLSGVNSQQAREDRRFLTYRVNAIKLSRNQARGQKKPLVEKWGEDIANAILAFDHPPPTPYLLRAIIEAGNIMGDYWKLRRRANRLLAERLLRLKGNPLKRKRCGVKRYVLPREWLDAAAGKHKDGTIMNNESETIPDEWLRLLDFHIDEFGVLQGKYQSSVEAEKGLEEAGDKEKENKEERVHDEEDETMREDIDGVNLREPEKVSGDGQDVVLSGQNLHPPPRTRLAAALGRNPTLLSTGRQTFHLSSKEGIRAEPPVKARSPESRILKRKNSILKRPLPAPKVQRKKCKVSRAAAQLTPAPESRAKQPSPSHKNVIFKFFLTDENYGAIPQPMENCETMSSFFDEALVAWGVLGEEQHQPRLVAVKVTIEGVGLPIVVLWRNKDGFERMMNTVHEQADGKNKKVSVEVRCIQRG